MGSFDERAERLFNGRRTESAELRRLVLNAPFDRAFWGFGLGKTSLVQAGLFPQLRKEIICQVRFALQTQLAARKIDAPAMEDGESLGSYVQRAGLEMWSEQNQLLTPIFVFDQFEEVSMLGAENPAGIDVGRAGFSSGSHDGGAVGE